MARFSIRTVRSLIAVVLVSAAVLNALRYADDAWAGGSRRLFALAVVALVLPVASGGLGWWANPRSRKWCSIKTMSGGGWGRAHPG
jgi:hypothetical protein